MNVKGCKQIWVFEEAVPLSSGDTFYLKIENPATHPLPNFELLEMHWRLNMIVSISGATAIFDARGPIRHIRDQVWMPRRRSFGRVPLDDDFNREKMKYYLSA